jgi:hypothetical protein
MVFLCPKTNIDRAGALSCAAQGDHRDAAIGLPDSRPIGNGSCGNIYGMLPLAFALGAGSQVLQPFAIAVIGGLVFSIFLSLVVSPVIYYNLTKSIH